MNLRDLKENVGAITLHDLTETNVASIEISSGSVVIEATDLDAAEKIADLADDLKAAEEELKDMEKQMTEEEMRADKAEAALAAIKDGPEIAAHLAAKEEAEANSRLWQTEAEDARRELTGVRKKKGITARYFQHHNTILAYLHNSSDPKAQEIVKKLHAK